MPSIIEQARQDIIVRQNHWEEKARTAMSRKPKRGGFDMGGAIASSRSASSMLSGGDRQQQRQADAYTAFRQWVYVAVNCIARRLSGQPWLAAEMENAAKNPDDREQSKRSIRPSGIKMVQPWLKDKSPRFLSSKAASEEQLSVLPTHPVLDALDHPNPLQRRAQFLYLSAVSLNITGVCYWIGGIVKDKESESGEKLEVWCVPSNYIAPVHDSGLFTGYKLKLPGEQGEGTDIPVECVARTYYPDPTDLTAVYPPLAACWSAVRTDEFIQRSQENLFERGLNPKIALVVGKDDATGKRPTLQGHQRRALVRAVREVWDQSVRFGDAAILDGLIEDIKRLDPTAREMDWMQSGKVTKDRIFQTYGVNPIICGEVTPANKAQATVAEHNFAQNVLNPLADSFSETATTWMGPMYEEPARLVIWIEPIVVEDEEARASKWTQAMSQKAAGVDEYRAEVLGLPPMKPEKPEPILRTNPQAVTQVVQVLTAVGGGQIQRDSATALFVEMGINEEAAVKIIGKEPEQPAAPAAPSNPYAPVDGVEWWDRPKKEAKPSEQPESSGSKKKGGRHSSSPDNCGCGCVDAARKHLEGQHDQSTHGHGDGGTASDPSASQADAVLAKTGTSVSVVADLKEAGLPPHTDGGYGAFDAKTNTIYLATSRRGKPISDEEMAETKFHETGHALDYHMDNVSLSQGGLYQHGLDAKKIDKTDKELADRLFTFIRTDAPMIGSQEAYAQSFSFLLGGPDSTIHGVTKDQWESLFPNTMKFARYHFKQSDVGGDKDVLDTLIKHLEGQHDQSTHGRSGESGPATEEQIKATVHLVEDEIRKSYAAEVIVCIGADGKEIIRKQGEQDKCAVTPEEMQQMAGAKVVTHNHPGGWSRDEDDPRYKGNSFSNADVRLAVRLGVEDMRVVSPGYRFSLKIPSDFAEKQVAEFEAIKDKPFDEWTEDQRSRAAAWFQMYERYQRGEIGVQEWAARTVVESELRHADHAVRGMFQPKISYTYEKHGMEAAQAEIAKAESAHAHEVMLRVSKELGWTYTREEYKEWPKSSTKPQSKSSGSTASHRSLTKSAPRRKRMGGLGITRKQLHALHLKKHGKQERRMAKALKTYFSGVVDDVAGKLSGKIDADDPDGTAERLIDKAFDADQHLEDLVKAISPHMAAAFADGAMTEYKLGQRARKAIVERMQTKHLEGQHDQQSHAGERQSGPNGIGVKLPDVGEEVRVNGSRYWAEPTDGDDSFPPAIAGYEVMDGYMFYRGRNGSEGVVTGTQGQMRKWIEDVNKEIANNPPATAREWMPTDGGEDVAAKSTIMATKAAETFGIDDPGTAFVFDERTGIAGEHSSGGPVHVWNPQQQRDAGLNFKTPGVSGQEHTAAHEIAHRAYAADPSLGQQAMEAMQSGDPVSFYQTLAGNFEGLMDAAAAYVHSPQSLNEFNPSVFKAVETWATALRQQRFGTSARDATHTRSFFHQSRPFSRPASMTVATDQRGRTRQAAQSEHGTDGLPAISGLGRKSTASDLLEELGLDFPEGFSTEVPQWVIKAATDAMIECFEEDYWMDVISSTRDDLMATLQRGVREGVSIRDLAAEIKELRGDEYAKWRATNTARTETNWMLSSGAREGVKQTAEETGLPMGLEWNSLFSSTSRPNHMDFDATETESADGLFQFPGQDGTVYEIAAPGDPKLPPADRCNCLCFLVSTIVSGELSPDEEPGEEGPPEEASVVDIISKQAKAAVSGQSVILEGVHDVRQPNNYWCGAAAAMAAGRYFGVGPEKLDDWAEALGTTEEKSTAPQSIVEMLTGLGLAAEPRHGMSIDDLSAELSSDRCVICPVQDYTGERSPKAAFEYGHWLLVIGRVPGHVVAQDSSLENLQREPGGSVKPREAEESGNIAVPGRKLIADADWLAAWHDVGEDGAEYVRFGIVVGRATLDAKMAAFVRKHLEGQHDQQTHGRSGGGPVGGTADSESMVIEPAEQGKLDEQRYQEGMAAWERYRDMRQRARERSGYGRDDDWDAPYSGLKARMDRATHLDELVTKLNRMQGSVKAQLTKHANLGTKLADLETKRNNLQKFMESGPTNPATGESTAHEYKAEIDDIEKQMAELAPKVDAAYEAYAKLRDAKMERMVQTVRESIQGRMKDQLEPAQKVSINASPQVANSEKGIEQARALLSGCVSEKIDWKAATCAVETSSKEWYGGNRAYFMDGKLNDPANMTLGTIHLPESGADVTTVVHEFGHCLEQDYEVRAACQAFLWHRVGDERPKSMQDVVPGGGYDKHELGRKDEFDKAFGESSAYYVGKFYQQNATEVLSMGMEKLFYNPREFAQKDPEYFKFVVGVLDGSLLPKVAK